MGKPHFQGHRQADELRRRQDEARRARRVMVAKATGQPVPAEPEPASPLYRWDVVDMASVAPRRSDAIFHQHLLAAFQAFYLGHQQERDRTEGVPCDGVRVGEVIGWRAWLVDAPEGGAPVLRSCHRATVWQPGQVVEGDVKAQGVHSWKHLSDAINYGFETGLVVVGSIALWGEVVEHEKGYRAQFGKPRSFEAVINRPREHDLYSAMLVDLGQRVRRPKKWEGGDAESLLGQLRERYLVPLKNAPSK